MVKPFIYILLFIFCSSSVADDFQERINWFSEAQWGLSAEIKLANNARLSEIMKDLGELWMRRDGALGYEVAPFITEIVAEEPSIVFVWFHYHPKDFTAFVKDIQHSVFTDYNGEDEAVKELELLRAKTISACKTLISSSKSTEIVELAKALESELNDVVVRTID
ncbi:hypothetical protein P886_0190 [Alteromonadaceae bacterium 2753L.S.0a.02]|nr:hypothetical protein P886_0190 [Alteromonadaceae bacterium 2753L.S.0a.02]